MVKFILIIACSKARKNFLIKENCNFLIFLAGDHPDADNIEHMKSVWSLCQNLWGDVPDNYKINPSESSSEENPYEMDQIRKRLLSEWLADVSAHRVERESKMFKLNKVGIFILFKLIIQSFDQLINFVTKIESFKRKSFEINIQLAHCEPFAGCL